MSRAQPSRRGFLGAIAAALALPAAARRGKAPAVAEGLTPERLAVIEAAVTDLKPVTGITVTTGGSGYTSAPVVTFSGCPGSGARATATLAGIATQRG